MDIFAQIASNGIGGRDELLYDPQPPAFEKRVCERKAAGMPCPVPEKISTKDELYEALRKMKAAYQPFLQNLAPDLGTYKDIIPLKNFLLDGEEITIPHYQGPQGKQKQTYTTSFELNKKPKQSDKAAYICFQGADYYAVVYINGCCVGTHEGFFSPFEFEITDAVREGTNTLQIDLYNDYVYVGNAAPGHKRCEGDKLYAATGLGWDDAAEGWHHCPAGMGIYNDVCIEIRNRVNITDLYVRPMEEDAEIWVEIENADYVEKHIEFEVSIFGQNFREVVLEDYPYVPETIKTVGRGDTLTEAAVRAVLGKGIPMPLKHGKNIYKIPVRINNPRLWELDTPYLYQAQVKVIYDGSVADAAKQQFGMRSFRQDTEDEPKGMFYLNGRKIRLRGANTMGFEQQDVMRGDINALVEDILLAKLCNMNFLRLTQRPVQNEVYEYCDKLGLMTQSDLPLFGCMRRNKLCEGIRQAEEMERLIRKHPCNILVSYINEPFPNANNEPHRHLTREELEIFFTMCDMAVRMQNPDRVIKHVDGDYDPPTEGMPDNHCYPMWYNGHGIDIGKLNRGYWMSVKPGWYYGCGEYGAEGLDFCDVMTESYPKEWIREPFSPGNIVGAQTGSFHYFFFDTQDSMEDWVEASQSYQAFATQIMTEAFRRDNRMISNAIHLFIDAWPSGWMKTIMDCRRNPKKAYFAYRNALEPVHLSLRTDRYSYYSDETVSVECYLCNDTNASGAYTLRFEYYVDGLYMGMGETEVTMSDCASTYAAHGEWLPEGIFENTEEKDRAKITVRAILLDGNGKVAAYNDLAVVVFKEKSESDDAKVMGEEIVWIEKLPVGRHEIAGETVEVKPCGMQSVHFVSRKTGHPAVDGFQPRDFSYWFDQKADRITPILDTTFTAKGFIPILTSGNMDETGAWKTALACAEKVYQGKRYIICQVDLRQENPVARRFVKRLAQGGLYAKG